MVNSFVMDAMRSVLDMLVVFGLLYVLGLGLVITGFMATFCFCDWVGVLALRLVCCLC